MKKLKKLLLIHWHYFDFQLIEFDQLNFLTGQNASGKSTLIDAMQLVLLGDTAGRFFNKSASGRTNRTLPGYLLGELGDDEQSGFRYLRDGQFTSYIAMEFFDEEKTTSFTAGICFDVYSQSEIRKRFFLYDGELDPDGFIRQQVPMDSQALRSYLKENYPGHYEMIDSGKGFQTKLYGKLGGLKGRFGTLLKKAVSFNPDVDLQKFITEFVCDVQEPVDISHMQENIRSYKRLEEESINLNQRVEDLKKIVDTHEDYQKQSQSALLYDYLIKRAKKEMKSGEVRESLKQFNELSQELEERKNRGSQWAGEIKSLREKREELIGQRNADASAQKIKQLEMDLHAVEIEIRTVEETVQRETGLLERRLKSWQEAIGGLIHQMKEFDATIVSAVVSSLLADIETNAQLFFQAVDQFDQMAKENYEGLTIADLNGAIGIVNQIRSNTNGVWLRLQEVGEEALRQKVDLEVEKKSLEAGRFSFPEDTLNLKQAISSRLHTLTGVGQNVRILAEVCEISDPKWQNAVEGYLHTQKYYLLVAPEYFSEAARVYEKLKEDRPIYGSGIVDSKKLERLNRGRQPGSLAEEVTTEDQQARIFLDYVLGTVQKCDGVEELREHSTAITASCMVYSSYVIRALHPDRWKRPAIGQAAIILRLEAISRELKLLDEQLEHCKKLSRPLKGVSELEQLSGTDQERIIQTLETAKCLPKKIDRMNHLRAEREAVDTATLDSLNACIAELQDELDRKEREKELLDQEIGTMSQKCTDLNDDKIPKLQAEEVAFDLEIASKFEPGWILQTGDLRYMRELESRGQANRIQEAFPRELSRVTNAKDQVWYNLLEFRRYYNDRYKMGYDINQQDNSVYDDAWLELTENQLPKFDSQILDAKKKAFEQFQEDFLSRLKNNINKAKTEIDQLNKAIHGATFGEDSYRFKMVARPEYKRYYEMIMDDMLSEGYDLLSHSFNAKYQEEINDLFSIVTDTDGAGGPGSSEYEKRVHEFTDFRTYLSFDLEVKSKDGSTQRLSKTLGKKSGGETQTPFYIAVLASFAQLYRTGRDKVNSTARLIIFDEAFSKMDGERIVQSIELLRRFNFQVILSAPPDKVSDISTLVDRNLVVYRKGARTTVQSFSPKQAGLIPEVTEGADEKIS